MQTPTGPAAHLALALVDKLIATLIANGTLSRAEAGSIYASVEKRLKAPEEKWEDAREALDT